MGSACSDFADHVMPPEPQKKSNDVKRKKQSSKYNEDPQVEFVDLLVDAEGNIPRARQMHTLCNIDNHSLICYGGFCAPIDTDDPTVNALPREGAGVTTHPVRYSIQDNAWFTIFGPAGQEMIPGRGMHAAMFHDGFLYIFGSHKKDRLVMRMHTVLGSWSKIDTGSSPVPESVMRPAACVVGDGWWFFGGETDKGLSNELWCFDINKKRWFQVVARVDEEMGTLYPRVDHSMVLYQERFLVYGGVTPSGDDAQSTGLIQFSAETKRWSAISLTTGMKAPPARKGHACTMYHHYMIVFGGAYRKRVLNDLWVYDVHSGFWVDVEINSGIKPAGRCYMATALVGLFWHLHGGGDEKALYRSHLRTDVNEIVRRADETFEIPDARLGEAHVVESRKKHILRRRGSLTGNKLRAMEVTQKTFKHFSLAKLSELWANAMFTDEPKSKK